MSEEHSGNEKEDTENHTTVNRRRFVKGLGVAGGMGAYGVVSSTPVSAKAVSVSSEDIEKAKKVIEPYHSVTVANQVIKKHGDGLLTELSKRGVFEDDSISQLQTNVLMEDQSVADEGVVVLAVESDGEPTPEISVEKSTKTHDVTMILQPEEDVYYATADPLGKTTGPILAKKSGQVTTLSNVCQVRDNPICRLEYTSGCILRSFGRATKHNRVVCRSSGCHAGKMIGCCGKVDKC